MNDRLELVVTKEEVKGVLYSFKKVKSHNLYGWTIELYFVFYKLLEEDILRVIE